MLLELEWENGWLFRYFRVRAKAQQRGYMKSYGGEQGGIIGMVKSGMGCQQQADCPGWGNQSQKDGGSSYSYEGAASQIIAMLE